MKLMDESGPENFERAVGGPVIFDTTGCASITAQ